MKTSKQIAKEFNSRPNAWHQENIGKRGHLHPIGDDRGKTFAELLADVMRVMPPGGQRDYYIRYLSLLSEAAEMKAKTEH